MCSVLRDHLLFSLDSMTPSSKVKDTILSHIKSKTLVPLSQDEIANFCGNVLMLTNEKAEPVLVMSERAKQSFSRKNWNIISEHYKSIVSADLTTIENIGGGSARCMIAELF